MEQLEIELTHDEQYDGLNFSQHMVAGAIAGIAEHIAMFPVDTIKTRMQALAHPGQQLHSSMMRALNVVIKREGFFGLYRGITAVALGAGPSHALYFAAYEQAKQFYGGNEPGHHPIATAAAGISATLVNDGIMTPWDVVKQRMQMSHSPYRSLRECIWKTWQQDGILAFYKSYWVTVIMNVPYTGLHFATYESTKKLLKDFDVVKSTASSDDEGLAVQLIAGGLAGGTAAAATNPFDVLKTRLQLEGVGSATRYNTVAVLPMLRRVVEAEGTSALWRGWQPRVLFHVPSAAICWGMYESCKTFLHADKSS